MNLRYTTDHVAHYGGSFTPKMVTQHPLGGTVLRFAEPVDDLNPVSVAAEGLDPLASAVMITALREALSKPGVVLEHHWQQGDIVIADITRCFMGGALPASSYGWGSVSAALKPKSKRWSGCAHARA